MDKSTSEIAIFNSFLYVYHAGYIPIPLNHDRIPLNHYKTIQNPLNTMNYIYQRVWFIVTKNRGTSRRWGASAKRTKRSWSSYARTGVLWAHRKCAPNACGVSDVKALFGGWQSLPSNCTYTVTVTVCMYIYIYNYIDIIFPIICYDHKGTDRVLTPTCGVEALGI